MRYQQGFTILEAVVALAVAGVLLVVMAAAMAMVLSGSPRQANKLAVEEDLSFVRYWLNRDASAADSFFPLDAPRYGYFQWRDFTAEAMLSNKVSYSYDSATVSIIREERRNEVVQSSLPVARRILSQGDARFSWFPGSRKVTVAISAAIVDAPGVGTARRTATIAVSLRPLAEPTVSPPGQEPILPPLPGSVTYYVSGEPTIISGSLASGNGASLHDPDGNYYVVNSVTQAGSKVVSWRVESEVMTAPPDISQIEVRFTGKASAKDVVVEFFVQNSDAGFPAIAASGFTFTQGDTLSSHSFYLDAATLAYINSLPQRRVALKIAATASPTFSLSTDQVMFIASP